LSQVREPVGSLSTALAHAERLLGNSPAMAEAQAREILRVAPAHSEATRILASALRLQGRPAVAREALEPIAKKQTNSAAVQFEWGLTLADLGESGSAIAALRKSVALDGGLSAAWLALADQLTLVGDTDGADAAYARHIKASTRDPRLLSAAAALCDNKLAVAERLLRSHLKQHPTDVAAIRMLAETGSRLGRYAEAEVLLARCLELAPSFTAARHNYASVLHREGKFGEALAQTEILLKVEPENPNARALQAALLGRIGDFPRAIACYEQLLARFPDQPKAWLSFGHALRAVGRQADAVAAYRRSIALLPSFGEAYWSLANLKTFRFSATDTGAMHKQLARSELSPEDRLHLSFALGKALEDEGRYAESFENYVEGNAIRRRNSDYNPSDTSEHVRRSKALYSAEFLRSRSGAGCQAPDPIFIVGLPRAGSTLIEQILSSHSAIEGTMELSDIISIAQRLGGRHKKSERSAYPESVATLSHDSLAALGQEYLDRTRIQRHSRRPFFIDKMPNNFVHIGLIHLILPNAKIIDARRHPLACCLSGFKQQFARGQNFTYDLTEIGRYYFDYADLMAHFDAVLPRRVHRIIHERLVQDPESEIRRLLDYCGVPFEEECLRFYQSDRPVRTASSEQVRLPIFRDALDQWQHFDAWLGPLKEALGPVLSAYPNVPDFRT
jgi:tetratricopeptide (TPR) repeat protein